MNSLAKKKYVIHNVKSTFFKANVTISKLVVNGIANQLYDEFTKCSKSEQERLLLSDELVKLLWDKYMDKINKEMLEEM
ncbi:TPA: hypothetical protein LIY66_001263 [Enterococcus faecium]|jgi:hypothetical protein|nr:hypothetical protein [Enterococcus faecium]